MSTNSQSAAIGNVHDYYAHRARWILERDNQPGALPDPEAWRELRPVIYHRLMKSLGLEAMPERCDLRPAVTGTFSGPGYTGKKIAYQLLPDCWGSAHLYRPADLPEEHPTPAVLYTCGHNSAGVIGYQHHAIAWARRGYTCLIFDTLEQHDNPGSHQDLRLNKTPEWIAMGYTAAGGEVFNGIRALDLLLAQPGVDPDRVGVTGLSGGGAQSFLLAVVDDRLKAVASACGVSDPAYAIPNYQVAQHCDCMYVRNIFAHDLSTYAALIAPRALLFCFARHDNLYTPDEFRHLHERTRARFERLGQAGQYDYYEYDGRHGYNHRATTDRIHQWFDHHVAGETHPDTDTIAIADDGDILDEATLSTFHGRTPAPNRLGLLPHLLSPRGQVGLPEQPAQWAAIKQEAVDRLRNDVFHLLDDVEQPQQLEWYGQWETKGGYDRNGWHGQLDGMPQSLLQAKPSDDSHEGVLVGIGERHQRAFPYVYELFDHSSRHNLASLLIEPRAAGYRAFDERLRQDFNRMGCMVGLTPTMMMVQDLHHLWPEIKAMCGVGNRPIYLYGKGEGAIAMLYHALLHPDESIAGVILEDLIDTHARTPHQVTGVLRVMDIPHAVGLLAPTPVAMVNRVGTQFSWYYSERAHARAGGVPLVATSSIAYGLEHCCRATTNVPA